MAYRRSSGGHEMVGGRSQVTTETGEPACRETMRAANGGQFPALVDLPPLRHSVDSCASDPKDQQDGQDADPGRHDRLHEGAAGEDMAAVGGDGGVAPQPAPLLSVFHELNPNEMLAKNSSKVRN